MTGHRISFFLLALSLAGSASWAASAAQTTTEITSSKVQTMEARNKAVVESALKAWMTGDGAALQALLSDDIEWTISGNSVAAGTTHGRQELMSKVLGPFGARFNKSPDRFRPREIKGLYADGDTVVAHFLAAGTTNSGQPYENNYVWILTLRDGKVVRATAFFDSIAFNELWQQPASQE